MPGLKGRNKANTFPRPLRGEGGIKMERSEGGISRRAGREERCDDREAPGFCKRSAAGSGVPPERGMSHSDRGLDGGLAPLPHAEKRMRKGFGGAERRLRGSGGNFPQ